MKKGQLVSLNKGFKRVMLSIILCLAAMGLGFAQTGGGLSFEVTPRISDWGTSFGGNFIVRNTGTTPVKNWVLEFDWEASGVTLSFWGAQVSQKGNHFTFTHHEWAKDIAPGATISIGFSATGTFPGEPVNYLLNGQKSSGSGGNVANPPGKTTLFIKSDPYGGNNFNLSWNIYSGEGAESWEIYESDGSGFKLAYGPFQCSGSNSINEGFEIRDKVYGVYKYKVMVKNKAGQTWSNELSKIVGGASEIMIAPARVDKGRQVLQLTQTLSTQSYELSCLGAAVPQFTVITNNTSVVEPSIAGSTLIIKALNPGRAGLKIRETTTGKERYVGVRVKTAAGELPGMPDYLGIGSVGTNVDRDLAYVKDFLPGDRNKRMDVRYVYLNGEPDAWDRNANGWQKWGANIKGHRAFTYIRENRKLGIIPFFVYYTICGANESYITDLKNIQDGLFLKYYFTDLKYTMDTILREAEDDIVGMIFEPDFIGYMMQNSALQPSEIYANTKLVYEVAYGGINAAGVLDSKVDVDPATGQPFANNLHGLVSAINYIVNKYNKEKGTNVVFGWQFNTWANPAPGVPGNGLMHKTDSGSLAEGRAFIEARALETSQYYVASGILRFNPHFISIDKYGKDAVAKEPHAANDPANSIWFWNADHWNNYLAYIKVLHQDTNLPVVLWQMPVGHIERSQEPDPYDGGLFEPLTNTSRGNEYFYEDCTVTYFFGDTFKPGAGNRFNYFKENRFNDPLIKSQGGDTIIWGSHFEAAKDAGIVLALFGAGVGEATHGNVSDISDAVKPEDDGWFMVKTQRYLKNPVKLQGIRP